MLALILDIFFHLLITWYVGNVFPGEFGIPRPFYFPFTVSIEIKIKALYQMINVLCSFNNNVLQYLMKTFNVLCTEVILGLLWKNGKEFWSRFTSWHKKFKILRTRPTSAKNRNRDRETEKGRTVCECCFLHFLKLKSDNLKLYWLLISYCIILCFNMKYPCNLSFFCNDGNKCCTYHNPTWKNCLICMLQIQYWCSGETFLFTIANE